MRLALAAFTAKGERLALRLAEGLAAGGDEIAEVRSLRGEGPRPSLGEWTAQAFSDCEGLLFVGACGIAVRAVAPHLRDKRTDPAVVAVDEQGRFAVSLVSGHLGGANALARRAAAILGATPVVTTATDLRGRFAVDLWAKEQGLVLGDRELAKAISAALLDGRTVGFWSGFSVEGPLPEGLAAAESGELGLAVTLDPARRPFDRTLAAVPHILTLGIGCRRGASAGTIERVARRALEGVACLEAVREVATLDRKAGEPGLLAFCEARGLPLRAYPAAELARVEGEFTPSAFVREVTGVDNVCERAAAAGGGRLLLRKRAEEGVTVAAAAPDWKVRFAPHEEKEERD